MNIDILGETLDKDIKNNSSKTFLINGHWGIGKTYFIKKYLNKKKYIYLSMFGIKDSKELEDNLFLELKNIDEKLSKICQFYDPCNIKTESFKSDVNTILKETIYIVLDDLEKKSDILTFKEIFGIVSALKDIEKIKIILIGDTEKIGINNFEIFNNLKELVIDKTYNINNYSKEALDIIIEASDDTKPHEDIISKEKYENYLISFNSKYKEKNLRTIKKMINFSGVIINNIETSKLSKADIQTLVSISFAVVVERVEHYNYDREHLLKIIISEYLANTIYPISKEELVEEIIKIYDGESLNSFNKINDFFLEVEECKNEEKSNKLFYLSSEKIEKRISKFVKNSVLKYNSRYKIDNWYNQLYEFYFYANLIEKKDLINSESVIKIIDIYLDNLNCEDISLFNLLLKMQHDVNITEDCLFVYKVLKDKIVYKYFMFYYDNVINTFDNKIYDSKKIADLITFILGSDFKNSDDVDTAISLLRNRGLFIPNLDGEIDEVIWNYVHEIWKGIATSDDSQNKKKMVNLLIQVSNDKYQTASTLGKYRLRTLNEFYNILQL